MKLNDQELPDEVVAEFVRIIEQADAEALVALSRKFDSSLLKGIRPIKANAETIRRRLIARLKRQKELDDRWRIVIGSASESILTDYLDTDFLRLYYRVMFALYGRARVLCMMSLSLQEDVREKTDRLEALEQGIGATVIERVDRELGKRIRPWLEKPRLTAAGLKELEQQWQRRDLVELAEETLQRQAERDQHLGNRKVLAVRLERLMDLKERLVEAGINAIKPLPELHDLRERIDEETNRLKELLEYEPSERTVTTDLVYQINQGESEEELHELYGLLEHLEDLKLLPRSDFRILYDAYHRKMSRLYEHYRPNVIVPAQRPPLMQMQHAFACDEPFVLLLDGHNILFCLPWMFSQYYEEGCPGQLARETLVSRMIELADPAPRCKVHVFFDSPTHTEEQRTSNVHVQFSGGTGDHRADKAILKYLDYCSSHMSAMPRCLVTDDRELAGEARSKGAMVIKTAELATVL